MTVAVTVYSDTDRIRAALGVDEADVSDDVLIDMQLELEVEVDLTAWIPGFDPITEVLSDPLAIKMMPLYVAAFCAFTALDGRELLYPYLFKDGKAETRRFQVDLQKLKDDLAAKVAKWKAAIIKAEGLTAVSAGTASFIFGSAPPDYDPVAGA